MFQKFNIRIYVRYQMTKKTVIENLINNFIKPFDIIKNTINMKNELTTCVTMIKQNIINII